MKIKWITLFAVIVVVIGTIIFISIEVSKNKSYSKKIELLKQENEKIKQQLDSLHQKVQVKDKLLLNEIDSLYSILHLLNERRTFTKNEMEIVKKRLTDEQQKRKEIISTFKTN
ncbi:MAG: hypothetical protein RQ866_01520 [Bacteroidales bacterium]|nr:hypothetical protein [Bacteroidales bacterium]